MGRRACSIFFLLPLLQRFFEEMETDFDLDALVDQYLGVQQNVERPLSQNLKRQAATPESPSFTGNAAKLFHKTMNAISSSKPNSEVHEYRSPSEADAASRPSSFYKKNPALRRIELWAERKKERRLQSENEVQSKELEECTFEPRVSDRVQGDLLAPHALYKDNKAWGYDEFVDRLVEARVQREQRRTEIEAKLSGYGDRWQPKLTTPEPFEFAKFSRKKIAALQKSYDLIAPIVREEHLGQAPSAIEGPSVPSGLFSVQASTVILDHSPKRKW